MKCKVLKNFIDKETKKLNCVDSVIDVSEERAKEIMEAGKYIEPVKEQGDDVPGEQIDADGEPVKEQGDDFAAMNLDELKRYASDNGIALKGARTKPAIIEAINAARQ